MYFNQIGKNDLAMSAFIIAALYYLLQFILNNSKSASYVTKYFIVGHSDRHSFWYTNPMVYYILHFSSPCYSRTSWLIKSHYIQWVWYFYAIFGFSGILVC